METMLGEHGKGGSSNHVLGLRSSVLLPENDFVGMDLAIHRVENTDLFSNVFFNLHKSTDYEKGLINTISESKLE